MINSPKKRSLILVLWIFFFSGQFVFSKTIEPLIDFNKVLSSWLRDSTSLPSDFTLQKLHEEMNVLVKEVSSDHPEYYASHSLLAEIYGKKGQSKVVKELLNPLIKEPTLDTHWLGRIYYLLGNVFFKNPDWNLDSVEIYYKKALVLQERYEDSEYLYRLYINLGSLCRDKGNYEEAISFYKKSVNSKYLKKKPFVFNKIAYVYTELLQLDSTDKYLQLCLQSNTDSSILHNIYSNLGRYNELMGVYKQNETYHQKALQAHNKALQIRRSRELEHQFLNSYLNIGVNYLHLGDYTLAKDSLEKAIQYETENTDSYERFLLYKHITYAYSGIGDFTNAIMYCQKLITSIEKDEFPHINPSEKAYVFIELKKDLTGSRTGQLMHRLLLFGGILVVICFLLTFFIYREKRKRDQIEQEKLDIISQHSVELFDYSNKIKDDLLNKISQELHDDILSSLSAIMRGLDQSKEQETKKSLKEIYVKLRNLIGLLNPPSFEFGIMTKLKELSDSLEQIGSFKINLYSLGIEHYRFIDRVELGMYRIIQEALENIVKYAHAKSIDIQLIHHEEKNFISLSIEDNGKGFNLTNYKPGIGINSMQKRAESLGGTFIIDSSIGEGTSIFVEIPVPKKDIIA